MNKVKQKISGSFRSDAGSTDFCRLRSYICTTRKNAVGAFEALAGLFTGNPFTLPVPE